VRFRSGEDVSFAPRALPSIRCWRQAAEAMPAPHTHDDIEVVVVDGAQPAHYEFGGNRVALAPGRVSVFWAVYPHTLARCCSGAVLRRLMVPSALFFSRRLHERLVRALLAGRLLGADADDGTLERRFAQWEEDLRSDSRQVRLAMVLEVEAWLRRLTPDLATSAAAGSGVEHRWPHAAGSPTAVTAVAHMCSYILEHVREPIHVDDVAAAAGLRPAAAMAQFSRVIGSTIADYISRCRVLEAQRLLVGTDATVADVGFEAGFGSVSQFYDRFTTSCGQTPLQYRKAALSA